MAVSDGEHILVFKELGLVSQVFDEATLSTLRGDLGIGHNRYSTTGSTTWENAQPAFKTDGQRSLALGHNGNLVNTLELAGRVGAAGAATTDSDLVATILARHPSEDLESALVDVLPTLEGAFSFVVMDERSLFAARDPHGLRPLSIGRLPNGFCVASETCALDIVGATFLRDVEPGELVRIDERGMVSTRFGLAERSALCIFEFVYLARPDSQDPRHDRARGPARAGPAARARGARRRRPRDPRARHRAFGRAGLRGGLGDPVRRGPDEEPVRRSHVHPAVAVAAGTRREAEAQPDARRGPRQAPRRDRRLDRARHHHASDRAGAPRGRGRRGAHSHHLPADPLAVLLRDRHVDEAGADRRGPGGRPDQGLRRRGLARLPVARGDGGRDRPARPTRSAARASTASTRSRSPSTRGSSCSSIPRSRDLGGVSARRRRPGCGREGRRADPEAGFRRRAPRARPRRGRVRRAVRDRRRQVSWPPRPTAWEPNSRSQGSRVGSTPSGSTWSRCAPTTSCAPAPSPCSSSTTSRWARSNPNARPRS